MLILKRNRHEGLTVYVGDLEIRVSLVECCGGQSAKIGIEAPPEVLVLRDEVPRDDAKHRERLAAKSA